MDCIAEKELWCAVIFQALQDIKSAHRELRINAEYFFHSPDFIAITSFLELDRKSLYDEYQARRTQFKNRQARSPRIKNKPKVVKMGKQITIFQMINGYSTDKAKRGAVTC